MRELKRSAIMRKELSKEAKLSIFKSVYIPVLTYGHESWILTEKVRSRVQAAEMRFLRAVKGVSLLDRMYSTDIRESLEVEPLLLKIERSQLRWYGHVLRMPPERPAKKFLFAKPTSTRPRGRPRTRWINQVEAIGTSRSDFSTVSALREAAEDRDLWKAFLTDHPPRP